MEKRFVDRRLRIMQMDGVTFRTNAHVGVNVPVETLSHDFDALVLAGGACWPRDLPVPGRELGGIHFAMEYLSLQNRRCEGDAIADGTFISARGKRVVIIGGGDTGADCLGTVHRQGALSVHQFELLPRPPDERAADNPWPQWPNIFRVSGAHEEGGERVYAVSTHRFLGDAQGRVRALEAVKVDMVREGGRLEFRPIPGSEFTLEVELVLLAMGFLGPERPGMLTDLGVKLTERGNVWRDASWMTSVPGVFACGDMQRGQSLIVWAIAEGRSAARGVDLYLMGKSDLPAPLP
jgi:glutamate synthase (NADPH) small chain